MRRCTLKQLLCVLVTLVAVGVLLSMFTVLVLTRQQPVATHARSSSDAQQQAQQAIARFYTPLPTRLASRTPSHSPNPNPNPIAKNQQQQQPLHCLNTEQGALLVADDRGRLCVRTAFDALTGCCLAAHSHLYACRFCNATRQCCARFEECVSCCMRYRLERPDSEASRLEAFAHCKLTCRTSALSLDEHARYRYPDTRHCYDAHARPTAHTLEQIEAQLEPTAGDGKPRARPASLSDSEKHANDDDTDDDKLLAWWEGKDAQR